jgi:hypothetical protein
MDDRTAAQSSRSIAREKLERTRMLMDKHAEDALVTGYEDLIDGLHLPIQMIGTFWLRRSAGAPT